MQQPTVSVGTVLSIGTVVEIRRDCVVVVLQGKRSEVSFADVEFSLKGEKQMIKTHKRIGSVVNFMYPTHGTGNVLRRVIGKVVLKGIGPNGPFLTVLENDGKIRSLSTKKIVNFSQYPFQEQRVAGVSHFCGPLS